MPIPNDFNPIGTNVVQIYNKLIFPPTTTSFKGYTFPIGFFDADIKMEGEFEQLTYGTL